MTSTAHPRSLAVSMSATVILMAKGVAHTHTHHSLCFQTLYGLRGMGSGTSQTKNLLPSKTLPLQCLALSVQMLRNVLAIVDWRKIIVRPSLTPFYLEQRGHRLTCLKKTDHGL